MPTVRNLAADRDAFTSNVFLVDGAQTTLVDAGSDFDVVGAIRDAGADLDRVVLTHTHHDHVENLPAVRDAFDVPVFGFDPTVDGVDEAIADGDRVAVGDGECLVLHTPGHRDDHVCLYDDASGVLFAGDLVFAGGSFGRTDLEEGDRATLVESIERVLDAAGDDLAAVHTGHGPSIEADATRHLQLSLQAAKTR